MEQIGIVKEIENEKAVIFVRRGSSCGENCAHCSSSCEVPGVMIKLNNDIGAKKGDAVEISTKAKTIFKYTMMLYGIPMLFFIVGIIIGSFIFESEIRSIMIGLVGLFISFFILKIIDKKVFLNKESKLVINRILE